jgi:hypothetical protein
MPSTPKFRPQGSGENHQKPPDHYLLAILFVLFFLSGPALAVVADANILDHLRSLKAGKIAQLSNDCNKAEEELARCIRAPIKSFQKQNPQKPALLDVPVNPVQRKDPHKEKRAAIDAMREKVLDLQQNISRAEANDMNIIIEPFQSHFYIGQIGRVGETIYGGTGQRITHHQGFKVISIINDLEALIEFSITGYFTRFNSFGAGLGGGEFETKNIWLRGVSTAGLITGSSVKPPPLLIITGTQDYFTPVGAKQTVFVFEPLKIPADAL